MILNMLSSIVEIACNIVEKKSTLKKKQSLV